MFSIFNPNVDLPFVSVIVLTFNRMRTLESCLKSLYNMNYPLSKFEVIVIDGGSTDGTTKMFSKKFPNVRLFLEKNKGRPVARNKGWKYAKGQIVVYTDDDCRVDENWLRFLVSGFDSKETGAVGGPLLLLHQPKSIRNIFKGTPMGEFYLGDKKILTEELITANLAVKREVFERNRFDETLIHDLEDIDFCRSLMSTGYDLVYLPQAIVHHNINPKRLTISSALRRVFTAGISLYLIERKRNQSFFLIAKFFRMCLVGFYQFVLKRRFADFFWFNRCLIAFFSSIFLVARK